MYFPLKMGIFHCYVSLAIIYSFVSSGKPSLTTAGFSSVFGRIEPTVDGWKKSQTTNWDGCLKPVPQLVSSPDF